MSGCVNMAFSGGLAQAGSALSIPGSSSYFVSDKLIQELKDQWPERTIIIFSPSQNKPLPHSLSSGKSSSHPPV